MNFTTCARIAQASRSLISAVAVLGALGCGKKEAATRPMPADPDATVVSFLTAVRAEDLDAMADLWGSSDGPARENMDREELEQRLTIVKIYLSHEEYTIVPGARDPTIELRPGERLVMVRLTRKGCTPTVPFTLTPYRNAWLIRDIKLQAAGNPARTCAVTPEVGSRSER